MSETEKTWDVVVVGGANTDYLIRGPRLPGPGETLRGDGFQEAPGGKGANQAVAAARLGARVAFIGRVGAAALAGALSDLYDGNNKPPFDVATNSFESMWIIMRDRWDYDRRHQ